MLLIEKGANLLAKDRNGQMAADLANMNGNFSEKQMCKTNSLDLITNTSFYYITITFHICRIFRS